MGLCGCRAVGHRGVVMTRLRGQQYSDFDATDVGLRDLRRNLSRMLLIGSYGRQLVAELVCWRIWWRTGCC